MLRGIRRTIGTARAGKAPATADVLMQMVALCPDNMIGRRDRALLAWGRAFGGVCALQVETWSRCRTAAADPARRPTRREGQEVAIPAATSWPSRRCRRGCRGGDQCRAGVPRRGTGREGLRPAPGGRERRAGREAAHRVGLEASTFSGHSLRSGFLTSAAESGANVFKMAAPKGALVAPKPHPSWRPAPYRDASRLRPVQCP